MLRSRAVALLFLTLIEHFRISSVRHLLAALLPMALIHLRKLSKLEASFGDC